MVETSYTVPNPSPRYWCARNARARPLAGPPLSNADWGMRIVVARLESSRNPLMISATVVSSLRVSRTRPSGRAYVSVASPRTWGITATPVSKPDMPSASFGKTRSATPIIATGEECAAVMASHQLPIFTGSVRTCQAAVMRTTTFSMR